MTSAAKATSPLFQAGRRRHLSPAAAPPHGVRASTGGAPRPPAEEFAPLAAVFRRRLAAGIGAASLVAVGANFAGVTSLLLGLAPDVGRRLKLDALYPVEGYTRCLDPTDGFVPRHGLMLPEFIYPSEWVRDRTLLYRALGREEYSQRQCELLPLDANCWPRPRSVNEPVVAFGPPGSTGELNVSVVVSPVPLDFSIDAFGGPREVGEAVLRTVVKRRGTADVKATLVESVVRRDGDRSYYKLEFTVESPAFRRHSVAVCSARKGRLFTLNAQAPEKAWPKVKDAFHAMAHSFTVTF